MLLSAVLSVVGAYSSAVNGVPLEVRIIRSLRKVIRSIGYLLKPNRS